MLHADYQELQEKTKDSKEKYKRAALLMTEFLDDLLNSTPNILETEKDMHLNLEKIKETPFEKLAKEDKVALVLVLLKQLQPYLSANNLSTAPTSLNYNTIGSNNKHQRGGSHFVGGNQNFSQGPTMASPISQQMQPEMKGTQEVDTLNQILNNINVQTKNQNNYTSVQTHGSSLPPI